MSPFFKGFFSKPEKSPAEIERETCINVILDCKQILHFKHWLTKQHDDRPLEEMFQIHARFFWDATPSIMNTYASVMTEDLMRLAESYKQSVAMEGLEPMPETKVVTRHMDRGR